MSKNEIGNDYNTNEVVLATVLKFLRAFPSQPVPLTGKLLGCTTVEI